VTRDRQRRSSLLDRLVIAKTADELDDRSVWLIQVGHQLLTERQVDLRGNAVSRQCLEIGRQDTEHRIGAVVERESASDDGRVRTELAPEPVADDRQIRMQFCRSLVGREAAADRHWNSEYVEEVRRHNQWNETDR